MTVVTDHTGEGGFEHACEKAHKCALNYRLTCTPGGSCGSWSASSCNAATSQSIVASDCVGKNTCSIAANNQTFGDPCPGTYKTLAVQAQCTASDGGGAPGVRVVGRTLAVNGNTRFGWPGVAFHASFSGTQAAIQINDGGNQNAFEVVVDGGNPVKFRTNSGQTSYPLATGLASGTHDVLVWRSTEYFDSGTTDFVAINGFSNGGALLAPPQAPTRRIEVIGDSISVGAGLEGGAANCAADKFSTDNYYAYGSVAARAVNADVATIAYSGIGVYRSYGGAPTISARYDQALPADPSAWDFSQYQPQVVVMNLGTNDFSDSDPGQPYVDAYVAFAAHVRSKYPNAYFILIATFSDQETAVNNVVTAIQNGGDSQVRMIKFESVQNNLGCAQHPNKAAHQAMGDLLAAQIKNAMSW